MNWIRRNQGWGKRRGEVASIHPAHRGKSFKEGLGGKDAGGGFSKVPCKKSRLDASRTTSLGEKASTTNSGSDAIARKLAEDAVRCEPFSAENSLLTGKITGIFANFAREIELLRPRNAVKE